MAVSDLGFDQAFNLPRNLLEKPQFFPVSSSHLYLLSFYAPRQFSVFRDLCCCSPVSQFSKSCSLIASIIASLNPFFRPSLKKISSPLPSSTPSSPLNLLAALKLLPDFFLTRSTAPWSFSFSGSLFLAALEALNLWNRRSAVWKKFSFNAGKQEQLFLQFLLRFLLHRFPSTSDDNRNEVFQFNRGCNFYNNSFLQSRLQFLLRPAPEARVKNQFSASFLTTPPN